MPSSLGLTAIEADKKLREQLMPRLERLRALDTRLEHTVMLLGHEYFAGALAIYKALKAFGPAAGLSDLLADLKRRFIRARKNGGSSDPTPEVPGT